MSEGSQRQRVIRALRPLHAVAIENSLKSGTPDVNYTRGWIELKWLRAWPVRPGTVVALPHYTRQQRRWLAKRYDAGGDCWLLLQCRKEWLLFNGKAAACCVGRVDRATLYYLADRTWVQGLHEGELLECLSGSGLFRSGKGC